MQNGFIVIHRKMIDWEWFTDLNTCHLFLYCLIKANHENKKWQGVNVDRGSFITSLEHISKDTGLTVRQVRTALDKLKMTNELTSKTTSRYSIISIKNYNLYQDYDKPNDKRMTSKRQTNDKRMTTNNNDNNDNNDNNKEEVEEEKQKNLINFYGEFKNVYLAPKNYDKLKGLILNDSVFNELIEQLSNKIAENNEKYKPFDENFPEAHFTHLRKFWIYKQNNPQKFMNASKDEYTIAAENVKRRFREYKEKQKNGLK